MSCKRGEVMSKCKDLTGYKFERLTVIKYLRVEKHKAIWLCQCEWLR